jgi:hypothetical protein
MQFVQVRSKFFVALGIIALFVTNHSVAAVGDMGAVQLIGHKHENRRLQESAGLQPPQRNHLNFIRLAQPTILIQTVSLELKLFLRVQNYNFTYSLTLYEIWGKFRNKC